jgi:predicted nucleic acid-binding protein
VALNSWSDRYEHIAALVHPEHPLHLPAKNALVGLRLQRETLSLLRRTLWILDGCNPPERSERTGSDGRKGRKRTHGDSGFFLLLPYTSEVTETWKRIVTRQCVYGKQAHDAHLVAVMLVHSVARILTFNAGHFRRFSEITVVSPEQF